MVRSSAVGEDSIDASFAGQLDSFQTNGSIDEVMSAIRKCWSSYWSARSLSYQQAKGKILKGMGVIIQELVDPLYAGVVFTKSPNNKDELLIEYCEGHGESLVAGKITPGEITFNKQSKSMYLKPLPKDAESVHTAPPVSEKSPFINELVKYSFKLETLFQCPLDIEWAINRANNLFLLQARPITTHNHQQNKIFWSNVNVNENYPEPISPFLYSVAFLHYNSYYSC